jgi:hypothetical protein
MDDKGKRGWAALVVIALILAVLLPACYVLSIGPVLALYDNGYLPYVVGDAYLPLVELCRSSERASDALDTYIVWWRGPPMGQPSQHVWASAAD